MGELLLLGLAVTFRSLHRTINHQPEVLVYLPGGIQSVTEGRYLLIPLCYLQIEEGYEGPCFFYVGLAHGL